MLTTTTLKNVSRYVGKMLSVLALVALVAIGATGQPYNNGNLSTGATSSNGTAAPAGATWSEVQLGNNTAGFSASVAAGFSVADDFTVPAGQRWSISKLTFYGYSTGFAGTTSPFTDVRFRIFNTNPTVGSPAPIFGDMTTNRFSASSNANMFRIFNATPGTTRTIWNIEANANVTLDPGTYWIEWQMGAGTLGNFAPPKTVVGTVTQAGNNAFQRTVASNTWAPLNDGANRQDMPFKVDYSVLPCVAPTASVLSQVGYATPALNLINETFTTAIPLPANWAQQNLSTPAGATVWFQGNTGVFPGNTPPGYIAANFNNVSGANTISNWLFAPNITMKNGDSLTFFTRTTTGAFPDRLQVRRSQNGASTNVGASNTSVGDFTDLLLDINPTYSGSGYPTAWTKFTVVMSGLPAGGVSGRIAFRYFVENGGPAGANSDYIGLDDVVYRTPGADNPPNTCLGSTANLKVDITGGVAPYTVVINTVPPTTPIVVNNYQSGANIPVTPTATTQYTLTSVTGCGLGTGNSGTPTIVVNNSPFPNLTITSLPNTPICAGDPALLTVGIAGGGGATPLNLSQSSVNTITTGNSVSCNAGGLHTDNSYWRAYDLSTASIPAANYTVNAVQFGIELANAAGTGTTQPVTVRLYTSAGAFPAGVRTLVGSQTYNIPDQTLSLFVATLTTPVIVPSNAILVVEVFTPSGQAAGHSFFIGSNAAAETAPSYLSAATCGVTNPTTTAAIGFPNMRSVINLQGSYQSATSLPSGTTYSWTPITGLSNPTANPVAASPMSTTTYTVLVTIPGGCQGTATRTVVVNQPPAVTTQPTDVVVCATGSASFSVTATGAGPLTYQWQEQVGGVGAWNNLGNVAPYSGANTATLTINPVGGILNGNKYRCVVTGICNPTSTSNAALLSVNALPVVPITPAGPVCGGVAGINGTQLTAGSAAPPVPGSMSFTSGTINLPVPDNTADGVNNTIAVSGIPANATITNVTVKMSMAHTYPGDMIVHLRAPNNNILNLYKYNGGTFTGAASVPNAGWFDASINATSSTAFSSVPTPFRYGITAPAGPYRPDALNGNVAGPTVQNPTGFVSNVTSFSNLYSTPNGNWTLALADGGPADLGALTNWQIIIDYTTPGTGTGAALTYVWSPTAGLFTNAAATIPYAGTNLQTVYAAPGAFTVYTVTATNTATGCVGTNSVVVNYTPNAPAITPNPVSICVGNPTAPVLLKKASSVTARFNSGAISVPILDNTPAGSVTPNLAVSGIPGNAVITEMKVKVNATHTWVGDIAIVIKAPNNRILNLDSYLSNTGGTGATAGLTNTTFSSSSTTAISSATSPYTGTFRADGTITGGLAAAGPTGMLPTAGMNSLTALMNTLNGSAANGNYTLGLVDNFAGDAGNLSNWELEFTYVLGSPSTSPVWSNVATGGVQGLFSNAAGTTAYDAGTAVDSVWVLPTTVGTTNYQAVVQSLPVPFPNNPASIAIPSSGNGTPYPSTINVLGYPTTGVTVDTVILNGITHTWGDDIDILVQSPTGQNVILMSDVGGTVAIPAGTVYKFADGAPAMNPTAVNLTGTYRPTNNGATDNFPAPGPGAVTQATPTLASFGNTANVNGAWRLFVVDDVAGDQGSIAGGWMIKFSYNFPACPSTATIIPVTLNDSVRITQQPPQTFEVCTNKSTSISVAAVGTGLTYQWRVSSDNGANYTNVANGTLYGGVTTNTLTINSPAVSLSGNFYVCVVSGASPCASKTTTPPSRLTVNPLPTVVISANPYTKLFPGLTTTITTTSSPAAASYVWRRDGAVINATTQAVTVDVDGLGTYAVTVTDVKGCVNTSNSLTISDSATGKVFIYPNPNNGIFQVRYHAPFNTRAPRGLNIYDDKGSRIAVNGYSNNAPYQRMDVDLRKHGKGIYWVEVVDVNGERLAVGRAVVL